MALPAVAQRKTGSGLEIYTIESAAPDIVQIELFFEAGRWFEQKPLVATACSYLIKEGTRKKNAYQLAESIEYYGASLQTKCGNDYASISLYCLRRYAKDLLDIIFELLTDARFAEEELSLYVQRKKESLKTDLSNASIVGYRELTSQIYGQEHPYGYNSSEAYYDALTRDDLLEHYACYPSGLSYIFMSGRVDDHFVADITQRFDQFSSEPKEFKVRSAEPPTAARQKLLRCTVAGSSQTSLYMGRLLPKLNKVQWYDLMIANTIFGGFFGSRLMKNIREDKGYSYGVSSFIQRNKHAAALMLSTDVDPQYLTATIEQVKKEMERLKSEPIGEAELELVRNYLMGSFMQQFNGQSRSIRSVKRLVLNGSSIDQVHGLIDHLQQISPDAIRKAAEQHFNFEDYYRVESGKMP